MGECNRCAKCCFYPTGEKTSEGALVMKPCKHLVMLKSGNSLCRIYKTRLGTIIGKDTEGRVYRCTMYNSLNAEIEGCPMNIGGKPIVNVEIKGKLAYRTGDKEGLIPKIIC